MHEPLTDGTPEATWKHALRTAIRDPATLGARLALPQALDAGAAEAARSFPVVVPESFLARMRPGDPLDPLLAQVLPRGVENEPAAGFVPDPLGERAALSAPGLIQKYHGRALLLASSVCAVHCRYCFRRHFPYTEARAGLAAIEPALAAIAADPELEEVILSGGDPLVLDDPTLARLAQRLAAIPHVRRLRVHTRLPIVIPQRVTPGLIDALTATRLTPIVVVHANHPAELTGDCAHALQTLRRAGLLLLNQSVLLAGINDDADVLAELSHRLNDCGVLPYYLHQLDPVAGAAHFHVPSSRGRTIVAELHRRLPGYAVPRYVVEIPGAEGKVVVGDGETDPNARH